MTGARVARVIVRVGAEKRTRLVTLSAERAALSADELVNEAVRGVLGPELEHVESLALTTEDRPDE